MTSFECYEIANSIEDGGDLASACKEAVGVSGFDPTDWIQTANGGMPRWKTVVYKILLEQRIRSDLKAMLADKG